jgi:SP family sugar:H+ symporter-like MFS transporter
MGSTFLAEIAPTEIRGALIGTSIVLVDAAAVMAAGVNLGTWSRTTSFAYRLPLGIQIVFPIIVAAGLLFIRDSPTVFLTKSRDLDALDSLRRIRNGYSEAEIQAEVTSLKAQAALRQEEIQLPWNELFKGTNLRRTLLAMSIANFQQLSGIAFATNYATIFLSQIGGSTNPYVLVLGLSVLSLGGAAVGLVLVEVIGRRTLALSTFIIIFIIDAIIGALGFLDSATNAAVPKAIAAFALMFAFFFAAGFGPLTYVIASEIPTARLRNKTTSLCFLVLAAFNTVVVYVLPYISNSNA